MKNLYLWIAIITILSSCSPDDKAEQVQKNLSVQSNLAMRKTGLYPENMANEFDSSGQLHNEISEAYLAGNTSETTTAAILGRIETIANANSDFNALKTGYYSPSTSRLDYIFSNQYSCYLDIISNSSMSLKGKLSLSEFLASVMLQRDQGQPYEMIYEFIISYESSILADPLLTGSDRRIILTTASITRYSFYFAQKHKKKPRDRDWDISWGNIVAGTEGDESSMAKAIIMSATLGIMSNK